MSDLNQKLAAVIEKWPELRPTRVIHRGSDPGELRFNGKQWDYVTGSIYSYVHEDDAHSAIFRAMVEKLPLCYSLQLQRIDKSPVWMVLDDDQRILVCEQTAIDALLAFWLSRKTRGGEGEK